ncbi:hypothetical protein TNCV_1537771 [Trichonephila clavipes]|nr:hypothetical protein TNCV_1537771 [Trichonephila clavipes]
MVLNNKLSTVKEIIEELSQLKCAYYNQPDDTDLKDALDVTIDLQAEAQELEPSEISCLIGSEYFFDIFGTKQIRVPNSNFRLIDSKFGYVVTGSYIDEPCYFKHCFLSKGWNTLNKTLRSFWDTENLSEE